MPIYEITAPDGKTYEIEGPPGASRQDVISAIIARNPLAAQPPAPPKEGIMAALTGGVKRFGSTLETGLESIIDPTLAAQRGTARQEAISQQYAPGASLEKVKRAYEEKGLFPAAYEAVSQVPSALAEQFPNIASSIGGARVGAMAGSPFGPAGAIAGGIGGAFVPSLMQLYGSNLERQAQEKTPEISRSAALGAAVPGAAAEVASTFIPLGRNLIGKLLGPEAEKALARGTTQGIEAAAKETLAASLAKGAGIGALAEIPTEVTQQMLERYQAGLPLTTSDALAEYGESAYGAAIVGAPFGAVARGAGRPAAREEYTKQLQLEQIKAEQQRQKEAEAALKRAQEERTKTEEELGVPKMLALPAPAKAYEEPKNPLVDPVGRVTEDELGKAIGNNTVVNYINKYRKENNLPKLKSYSIEDIKDEMTAQNPEGEEGALNAILAYKTNYQNQEYTPDDIQNIAVAKNVATDTKGFSDFLTRATGKADLNTMTQPELHSVATALDALPRTGKEEQLVLPEGSNATRFTQDQYSAGITAALLGDKPVSMDEALKRVQTQKGIDSDQAAERLLRAAAANDDLTIEKGTGFQAVSATGKVLGTYALETEARRNHRRAEIKPVETELVTPRIEEAVRPEATLPEGYQIQKETTVGSEAPAAYVIREDGSQKNASQTFADEAAAKERLNMLERKREANAKAEEAAADRVRQDLEKRQAAIAQMEADGKTGTPEHTKAVYAFQAANVAGSQKITDHLDAAEALRTPLKIVPLGKKSTKAEKHTVIKDGKVVASFDTNDKAQAHVLSLLDDKALESIAERGGVMGKRASVELDMRQRPGVRGGTTEGLEKAGVRTPEVEAKLKELEKKLKPMLDKFGLGDVALNVVRAIENDAEGAWGGLNNLIRIAFNATNPIKTMRHEALHALFDLGFFTPQQWEALKREAKKTWVDKYLKNVPFNETMSRFDAYTEMGLSDEAILEEAIADAFGDWEGGAKPPPGMMAALFKRLQQFFSALRQALTGAGFESADEIFGKIERGELKSSPNTWKATPEDEVQAAKYSAEHGITPYVSEGQLEIPLDVSGEKYSIKQPYSTKQVASAAKTTNRKGEERKPKFLKNDPVTGLPMNANGTVTLYYPTTNEGARDMARAKVLKGHSPTANRIYLTNESSAGAIEKNPGMIQQPVGGANVLLQIDPSLINLIQEHSDGRKDFFIPIAEGEVFAEKAKMTKLFTLNAPRDKGLHPNRTLNEVAEGIAKSVNAWKAATPKEREAMAQASKDVLAQQHNVTALFGANAKLEKTNIGDYGLTYQDKKVMSTGLGLASAQRINDEQQATTCPKSAICEALCLGETSGQNELYGGEGPYRSGPRLSQYLKTEALVVNPEAFTTTLIKQIEAFRNEAKELDYYPAIRLNVTSDFAGKYLQPIIEMFPDVMFYDYTKLITAKPVAANHHLTYSSTGASQVVNGENIYNKESNWDQMVNTVLPSGRNVAMAFTSRNDMPEFVKDERTGKTFEVWNGDEYDARFLDPKREDGVGWIIGLTNKDRTTAPEEAAKKHNGFFLDYDAKRDGNTLVIPDQSKFKKAPAEQPVQFVKPGQKYSLRAREVPKSSATAFFKASEDIPRSEGIEAAEQVWSGGVADFGDKEAALLIARMPGYSEYAGEIEQLAWEHLAGGLYNEDRTVNKEAVERDGRFYVYRYGDLDLVDEINQGEYEGKFEPKATTLSLNFAKAFKNFARFDEEDKANKGWMRIAVKPESIIMLGSKSSEMELVVNLETVDTGDAQVIDESFEPVSSEAKFSLRAPDTKEFKQWFKDSKVVDKDGNPLVVYHATPKDFTFFDPRKLTKNTKHPTARLGFFTAVNPESTVEFISATKGIAKGMYEEGANIMPLYASIQNPAVIPSGQFVMRSMALQNMKKKDADKFIDDYLQSLRDEGHDGILIEADKTGRGFAGGNEFTSDNWVVLDASQLKSAIGNVGSYGQRVPTAEELKKLKIPVKKAAELQEKGDVRFSLPTYFPTAEEAEQAAYKKAPPTTPEFKRFFGASKVKEEGRPQVMYHGSLNDFSQFNEDNRKGLIFVTPSPAFAEEYALLHASRMEKQAEPPVKVYPLWVRAETPFDYENPVHVDRVMNEFGGTMSMNEYIQTEKEVKEGNWSKIEDPRFVATLKKLGFDSLYVKENRTKNLAVFNANQVKSVTGNIGNFSLETKDMRYSLKKVRYSDERFKNLWDQSFYTQNDAENKTKGYLAFVNPMEFVRATATPDDFERLLKEKEPIDFEKMKNYKGTMYLSVSERDGNWKITGHEGRHRMLALHDAGYTEVPVYIDFRSENAKSIPVKILRGQFANSLSATLIARELEPLSYANKNKAMEKYTSMDSEIKYSLPTQSAAYIARRDETTTRRESKGVIERVLESFAPERMADLRAAFIHRYNQLGVLDRMLAEKMGGKVLLADVSAEAAANMSDLSASVTASAFGIGNRKGGIPVYKNGVTTIDTSVKGPLEILSPLAQFNDPVVYQDYQYWASVQRGSRFMAEGRERNFEAQDIALVEESRKKFLAKGVDFRAIQKEMNAFNDGLVNYMVATGVLSKDRGEAFKKHMDYIPFFRQIDGDNTVGPKIFNSISGVKPPKKLKGSEAPLTDYLESIVRNTQAAINAGMKNIAAQKAINVAMQLGPKVGAQRLNTIDNGPDTVQVLENGKQVSYRVADQLFINAVKSLNIAEMPFLGFLSAPSNLLRNLVTKDPGFMLANLARDSLSAWVVGGSNATPLIGTASNFVKALGNQSPTLHALLNAGILGGYEFSSGVLKSGEVLEKDLAKKYGAKGAAAPLGVFTGIWDALEKGTEASDAATRMAVYDRVLAETGNEAEALYRALEVMNFNRKGSSPVVRILTAAIPFLNARIQGLDVFYRTAMGRNVSANAEAMQKAFFVRGATLMALSAAYFLAVSDDDEWKKQEQETKDNYWIAPGIGKFPTPFEVGFLFKTMTERIMAYTLKDDTGQDLMDSMKRGLLNTFAFNPIPQVAKPFIEYAANYNFFTGRPIVGMGMEGKEPEYQVGPNTTHSMEWLGKQLGMSPLKLEQVYGGFTGTMGMYALTAFDAILNTQSDSPHASKRFEQLPIIKRFAADPEARGNITQYYELKKAVDAAVETQNYLLKAGKPEEFAEFMEKNAGLLATKQYVANVEKTMKQMREMRKTVQGAEMTADEKRDTLIAIGQAENNLTQNIQTVKKMISEF